MKILIIIHLINKCTIELIQVVLDRRAGQQDATLAPQTQQCVHGLAALCAE